MGRSLTKRIARRVTMFLPVGESRGRVRRVGAAALGLATILVVSGCTSATDNQFKRLGLPPPASDRSPYMKDLWIGFWIVAAFVIALIYGLIIFAVIRYRRRSEDEVPTQVRYHLPIELLYTVAPLITVAVLFFFTVQKQDKIEATVSHPDNTIIVTAQQWSWTFNYLHEQAVGGTNVYDDGTVAKIPQLWLPLNQTVKFELHSPDVIHSFWVPAFYFKLDVIPGRENSFQMSPNRLGIFQGHCAELCGYEHARMLFTVHIVTPAQFDKHLQRLKADGHTGVLLGGINSHTVDGLQVANQGGTS
ncbi:MAG: aa3-type cytochrome oxidase subunit II [Nocardioidaceae bacterium]